MDEESVPKLQGEFWGHCHLSLEMEKRSGEALPEWYLGQMSSAETVRVLAGELATLEVRGAIPEFFMVRVNPEANRRNR